eukprot:10096915-Ditylum_brightwellii.AAC.1
MLDEMEMKFNHIQDVLQESVFTTKQFTIQVFCALLMLTNQDFIRYVKGKKDPFEEGRDVDVFDVINSVCTHYVNNKDDFSKMDPKDAAIIVFTTKLNTFESSFKSGGGNSNKKNANGNFSKSKGNGNGTGGGNKNGNDKKKGLPKWRITC